MQRKHYSIGLKQQLTQEAQEVENANQVARRPVPGYSLSKDGQPVSDEQIKEWLSERIAAEEAAYGYRKLTVCLRRNHPIGLDGLRVSMRSTLGA
jgi:hypothetical protein